MWVEQRKNFLNLRWSPVIYKNLRCLLNSHQLERAGEEEMREWKTTNQHVNGKTGDSRGFQASGATLRAAGVGQRGWQGRGAESGSGARLAGAGPARPHASQATSGQRSLNPLRGTVGVSTACLGGLQGQAHGVQVESALAPRPGYYV